MARPLTIRPAAITDSDAIAAIYAHYVEMTAISFETERPDGGIMASRIRDCLPRYPYLAAESEGKLTGYAYATRLYERAAYRWTAEATIYVAHDRRGMGIGRELYAALIDSLRKQGFQSVVGKITLPNSASVRLHERIGFIQSGILHKVGYKLGSWHDVGLYQLDLAARPEAPDETLPFPPDQSR